VTAETQMTRRRILLFTFSHLSVVFYITIAKNENLINIPINVTENNVDWNSYRGKTSAKYSRFRYDGRTGEMASSTNLVPRGPSCHALEISGPLARPNDIPGALSIRPKIPEIPGEERMERTISGISSRNFRCTSLACPNIPENRNNRKILFHSTIPSRPSFSKA